MEIDPDRTMPELVGKVTTDAGVPWLAGLLVAAPFAAVMSSVDSFLLLVSSSVVRDIYQKHIQPDAPEQRIRRLTYAVTTMVGLLAVALVVNPPMYLQDLIVFASGGLAACYLLPMLLSLYWPGMTAGGAIAGMVSGTALHVGLTAWGYFSIGEFRAYDFAGLSPFVWDLLASGIACIAVSKLGRPDEAMREKFFA